MDNSNASESQFRLHSLGIVAVNKLPNSDEVEILLTEVNPFVSGEITDNTTMYNANGVKADGSSYNVSIKSTPTVKATWHPTGDYNRTTSPNVRRGQKVQVYKFSDDDRYYWDVTGKRDGTTGRLETVRHEYSNNATEGKKDDADSTYYHEVSTEKGTITTHTSKSNGEPCAFTIQINAKEGKTIITTDNGLYLSLDGVGNRIVLCNSDNSFIDLNKTNITINATDSVTIHTKDYKVNSETTSLDASKTTNIKSGNSNTMESSTNTVKGNNTLNGPTNIGGGNGDATFTGTINGQNIVVDHIQANSVDASSYVHAPNI